MKLIVTKLEEEAMGDCIKSIPGFADHEESFLNKKDFEDKITKLTFFPEGGFEIEYKEEMMVDCFKFYEEIIPEILPIINLFKGFIKLVEVKFKALVEKWS